MSDIEEMAAPYVLGSLEPEERVRFESHLQDCGECTRLVNELAEGLAALDRVSAVSPPPHLRERVLSATAPPVAKVVEIRPAVRSPRRWGWVGVAAVTALIVGTLATVDADPIARIKGAADVRTVELVATEAYVAAPPSFAEVVFAASEEAAAVEFTGLAPPPTGMTYQLWLIDESGPRPAGLFVPEPDGTASVLLEGEARSGQAVAITSEPPGGLPQPSGEVLFLAGL